jgi:hypothetical protein
MYVHAHVCTRDGCMYVCMRMYACVADACMYVHAMYARVTDARMLNPEIRMRCMQTEYESRDVCMRG